MAVFLFLLPPLPDQAQGKDIFVSHLSEEDGLSPGSAMNFFQDEEGFLWIATIAGLNRYDGNQVITYVSDPLDFNSLSATAIHDVTQDNSGKIWIATRGGGLNSFCPDTDQFTHYRHNPEDATSIASDDLTYLDIDGEGQLWIGSQTALTFFNPATGKARQFNPSPGVEGQLQGNCRGEIIADSGRIYLATSAGFEYYDRQTGRFRYFPLIDGNSGDTLRYQIYGMVRDRQGKVWFGMPGQGLRVYDPGTDTVLAFDISTEEGRRNSRPMRMTEDQRGYLWIVDYSSIWRISPDRTRMEQLKARAIGTHKPLSNGLWSIYEDRSGLIWFGGVARQALFFDPRRETFEFHRVSDKPASPSSPPAVTFLHQDQQGFIWFGVGQQLYCEDPVSGEQRVFPQPHFINSLRTGPEGFIWLATNGGIYRFDPITHQSLRVFPSESLELPTKNIVYFTFDREGDLWLNAWDYGLCRLDRDNLYSPSLSPRISFESWRTGPDDRTPLPAQNLQKIMADSKGNLWLCGNLGGIARLDKSTGKIEVFSYHQGKAGAISNNYTYSAIEDSQGYIWISTNGGGLNRYDPQTESFIHYTTRHGLPSNVIFDLAFDGAGLLWLNTPKGISYFDPEGETFTNYNEKDGLQCWGGNLQYNAYTNTILSAGEKGINSFSPDELLNLNKTASPLKVVSVAHYDPKSKRMVRLKPEWWSTDQLELSHRESTLRLELAVLDFRNPGRHRYRYSLTKDGNPEWVDLQAQNRVDFARLDPGRYYFQAEGRNNDGRWSLLPKPLTIVVHPPFWQTGWAFALYVLLAGGILFFFYRFNLNWQLAIREAQQARELDVLKNDFFTNVTHEFRTPLTVILGMTEEQSDFPKAMQLIRRNGNKLLHLINQLLDLTKLESGMIKPRFQQVEIVSLTRYLGESLQSLAEKKYLQLELSCEMDRLWLDMDEEKYRQIIFNLLSNAIKFTPEKGKIHLRLSQRKNQLFLKIEDNGRGIPKEALPFIFNRFYQVDHDGSGPSSSTELGTGIGLALVKELVSLIDGTIRVESEVGRGTAFEIQFPIRRSANKKVEQSTPFTPDPSIVDLPVPVFVHHSGERPSLLLIEDNTDVVFYVQSLLRKDYNLQVAFNGAEGIQKAIDKIPDIIISDVMMPEKDGLAVVETLKQDQRTCHIPIILLTARATQEDRIAGLKHGADAYLMKPFDKEELFIRLKKLLELRRTLQERYSRAFTFSTKSSTYDGSKQASPTLDELFLEKIRQIINKKIGDADLDIAYLCEAVHLSPTQLYRKMKALTGEPPISLIRKTRLHRAMELLLTTDWPVTNIAYELGFSDPNYFSRAFRKEFGEAPSAVRK